MQRFGVRSIVLQLYNRRMYTRFCQLKAPLNTFGAYSGLCARRGNFLTFCPTVNRVLVSAPSQAAADGLTSHSGFLLCARFLLFQPHPLWLGVPLQRCHALLTGKILSGMRAVLLCSNATPSQLRAGAQCIELRMRWQNSMHPIFHPYELILLFYLFLTGPTCKGKPLLHRVR